MGKSNKSVDHTPTGLKTLKIYVKKKGKKKQHRGTSLLIMTQLHELVKDCVKEGKASHNTELRGMSKHGGVVLAQIVQDMVMKWLTASKLILQRNSKRTFKEEHLRDAMNMTCQKMQMSGRMMRGSHP